MTRMTVSVNNDNMIPYTQYGTDKQKAKAAKFAKANDKEITLLAAGINERQTRKSDKKFARNISRLIVATPLIAGVAAGAVKKGAPSAKVFAGIKSMLATTGAFAVIDGVFLANRAATKKSPKLKNAEEKRPIAAFLSLSTIATGIIVGADMLKEKISPKTLKRIGSMLKKDTIAEKINKTPEKVQNMLTNVKEMLPISVRERMSTIASKIKVPESLKPGMDRIKESSFTKTTKDITKKLGKAALKNPITTIGLAILAGIAVNTTEKVVATNKIKSDLKNDQLKTANQLIDAYAAENDSLKSANSKASSIIENCKKDDITEEQNKKSNDSDADDIE